MRLMSVTHEYFAGEQDRDEQADVAEDQDEEHVDDLPQRALGGRLVVLVRDPFFFVCLS